MPNVLLAYGLAPNRAAAGLRPIGLMRRAFTPLRAFEGTEHSFTALSVDGLRPMDAAERAAPKSD
jgi:hypothetical protein